MRVQNMFLYTGMHFKIKGGCQTLPRIFFVCFLDLRNNNIEMQRLENGRLHTHTNTHTHICTCTTTEENRRCRIFHIFFKLQRF